MHRAALVLTLESDLVLSARAATLGGHACLDYIPGAAILGWAASQLYEAKGVDSFAVFHSGKVRFGNGLPVTQDGKVAFPVPHALTEQKGKRDGVKDDRLETEHIRIAPERFPSADGKPSEAGESLKPCFVTPDGEVVMPRTGYRLKTAIDKGRAAENQLFGYQHIAAGTRFAASLEADDGGAGVSAALFDRLLAIFHDQSIALGRSRRAEYGGEIRCQVWNGAASLWPESSGVLGGGVITIWLLSDLALNDDYGAPALPLSPDAFGLPPGGRFLDSSTVTVRRYSPFNGYLRRPDLERTVIAAGSVLRYDCQGQAASTAIDCSAGFGLYREQGLGRVWINPPMLKGKTPCVQTAEFLPAVTSPSEDETAAAGPYARDLLSWLDCAKAEDAFQRDCEKLGQRCFYEIKQLYETSRAISGNPFSGPGRSQWGRVTGLCATAGLDFPHLRRSLTGAPGKVKGAAQPVCKGEGWDDEGMLDGADKLISFAGWMKRLLADQRWAGADGARALQETLGRLAERARLELVKEG